MIFHDNDILVPRRYAAEAVRVLAAGFEAARLQRLVFHLDPEQTDALVQKHLPTWDRPPVDILQNCEGHSLIVERRTYWEVGGHDEAFLGWGGEDNEMFDRLKARRLHDHAYLPFVHLHHSPQAGKGTRHANYEYFEARLRLDRAVRIRELSARLSESSERTALG